MMLASYVNAPGPGDPVYSPGGNPSLADTIGNALGLVATPVIGKVLGGGCTFALKGIGSGLSKGVGAVGRAVGRGIDKASKSAKRSKARPPKGKVKKQRNKPPEPLAEAQGRPHSIIERPGLQGQYTTYNVTVHLNSSEVRGSLTAIFLDQMLRKVLSIELLMVVNS